jgi:UDPglucose 6-dehydrogenase
LAFKANTDDIREAPALELIRTLTAAGMKVRAFDPVAASRARTALKDNPLVEVCEQQYEVIGAADALAVATDWNQFRNPDFSRIQRMLKTPIIFDGRNLYDPEIVAGHGLAYVSIGRAALSAGRPPESVLVPGDSDVLR